MKVSVVQGTAAHATYDQIDALLYLVENVSGYRDWDWLDRWLDGHIAQEWSPSVVIDIFANHEYWEACAAGDVAKLESIKHAILGTV